MTLTRWTVRIGTAALAAAAVTALAAFGFATRIGLLVW